ncbi:ABC transporter permease [Alienimonas californiensis]|uniref:FtsX-like permease family protein n=1 Tax=Alienimonas californiensis TaxID=2527989 RepID=A0A517P7S9_9PLAN|nr:ABC transporter permease [Alienimonas californiensis]QDT15413.1 FtsX-like permease family protein [Alienimonas californiensis]
MSSLRLVLASLWFYRRTHLAVLLGVAAGAAVIGGALVVGDSVRASLRQITLDRLGEVDLALSGGRFVTDGLVESLAAGADDPATVAPALALRAGLSAGEDDAVRRVGSVNLFGTDERLWGLLETAEVARPEPGEIVLNTRVAEGLGVAVGDDVTISVEIPSAVPRGNLLADRDDSTATVPLTVSAVLPDSAGAARFDLNPAQQIPPVAFAELDTLRDLIGLTPVRPSRRNPEGRVGRVNAVFVAEAGDEAPGEEAAEALTASARAGMTLDDLRVKLVRNEERGTLSVESDRMILEAPLAAAARRAAEAAGMTASPRYVALANEIVPAGDNPDDKHSAYFVVAGVERHAEAPRGLGVTEEGIVLNEFLATEQLGVQVGDQVELRWYPVDDGADAPERSETFTVSAIVPVEGAAADGTLTPTVEGITDAATFADWDQPFDMDLSRVTPADETYWDDYKALPKAFLPIERMRELFPSRYGSSTSVLLTGPEGGRIEDLDDAEQRFTQALIEEVDLRALGLAFGPVKAQGLAAAAGTTDFAGLFVGFSLFLILSAAILIALLFRLGLERRASEVGLERALGLGPQAVRRLHLAEGLIVVAVGGLVGAAAAVGYAALMLWGLRTLWVGAVGTRFLFLDVTPTSLAVGFGISVLLAAGAVWWGLRVLRGVSVRSLLAGETSGEKESTGAWAKWTAVGCGAIAAVLMIAALAGQIPHSEAFAGFGWDVISFFLTGMLLLAAALGALGWWLALQPGGVPRTSVKLGLRNAARQRTRSVLTAGLIACATFLLVAVAAARKDPSAGAPELDSGNGGYLLVAEAAAPLPFNPGTESGRQELNLTGAPFEAIDALTACRVRPGADASCLNLYRTGLPTVLGVPDAQIERGGFSFADTPGDNPWELLKQELPDAPVTGGSTRSTLPVYPVLGDMNTLQYSLKLGVGDRIAVPNDENPTAFFEVVGQLDGSVFQGVLLTSEAHFETLFPADDGWAYLLVDAPENRQTELAAALEGRLSGYGVDAEPVGERIASFLAVQNTYLSTFQALGGLGLLLGTLGLAAVMLRNVLERRGELALLRAVGLGTRRIAGLVLTETALLLVWGLASGTLAALLALWPHLSGRTADAPWLGGALTLLAVFAAGMLASGWAVRAAVRTPIVATLRGE